MNMKKIFSVLAVICTFALGTMAQSKEEKEVAEAVEKLKVGMVNADKALLESITADGLSYGHSGGHIDTRAEFVDACATGKSNFEKIDLSEQTIQLFGNTAIVRHKLEGATADMGKQPGEVHLFVLTVWQKMDGKWKLISRQAVKNTATH
jgi:ketosteroid isomerase-like protein